MKKLLILLLAAPSLCFGQNSYPSTGTAVLNAGSDQTLILKDGRSGTNWNYLEWQFSDGTRDWILGRKLTTGNFTLWRNGINDVLTADNTGRIGIGTTTPQQRLDVRGNLLLETGGDPYFYTGTGSSELNRYVEVLNSPQAQSASGIKAGGVLISDSYSYANPGKNNLIVKGSVGIGTANPDYPLTVNGSVHAKEIRVDLSVPGPDYVFANDYKLPSLEEIKNYIDQNKHLPEVPSAKEMEKNGVQLGEMNMLLLKKIEELTLHIIKQEERIKALESGEKQK